MIVTEQPVRDVPQEREIRDELQRLVLADLHGPLGGDGEEFSGENPSTDTRWAASRLEAWCWNRTLTTHPRWVSPHMSKARHSDSAPPPSGRATSSPARARGTLGRELI